MRRLISRFEAWQVRRFGRSVLGVLSRTDVLVLVVRGRRTGAVRSTPVAYLLHEGGWLVVGGAGGRQRDDLHDLAVARWPRIAPYERRSGRRAPVFLLSADRCLTVSRCSG